MASRAVEAGFDSLWLVDHFQLTNTEPELRRRAGAQIPGDVEEVPVGYWECCSALAALAATVPHVELGTLVLCTGYRSPALVAKIADVVDEICGGRLILGLGSGDSAGEHAAFGYPTDHMVGRFEEALHIIRTLLSTGEIDFQGQYYHLQHCQLRPRGPRAGGPPIMIGTLNPKPRMRRLVAKYADIWNAWLAYGDSSPAGYLPQEEIIQQACLEHGRDPASLFRTAAVQVTLPGYEPLAFRTDQPIAGSFEAIAEALAGHARQGVEHVQVWLQPGTADGIASFAKVLRMLEDGKAADA